MFGRFLTVGLECLFIGAGAAKFFGPLLKPSADENLPVSPYMAQGEFAALPPEVVTAVGAYEAIRETLMRDSLEGVAGQSEIIARIFASYDQRIASLAKGDGPNGFSFDATLMMSSGRKPNSRAVSSIGLPGS